jgi:hypothetical protein
LKALFACTLLLSLLASTACGPAVTPDEYFARAQKAAADLQRNADEIIRLEAAGQLDLTNRPEQLENAESTLEVLADNLKRASDGGHTLATYFLANLQSNPMYSGQSPKEACGLYQKAMDQGLLAAAIGYYNVCDRAYERFDLHNADHLKYLQTLEQLLQKPDIKGGGYPLMATRSLCFQDVNAPLPQQGIMEAMQARAAALLLTEAQYRAEANYILALTRVNKNDRPDSQNIVYLDKAEALGCKDFLGLSAMMRNAVMAAEAK